MKRIVRWVFLFIAGFLAAIVIANYRADVSVDTLKKKYANAASRFVDVDGMSVHYRDEQPSTSTMRDSVPLVLLHGTGASLLTWNGWVADLIQPDSANRPGHRVIRLDLPAYGLTGPNRDNNYSGAYYAQFLHDFLAKLGVTRCDLGGNSLGGAVAWRYALNYPNEVRNLILIDAGGYPLQSKSVPIAFRLARVPVLKDLLVNITPRSLIEKSIRNVYADDSRVTDALIDQYMDMALRAGNRKAFISRPSTAMSDSTYLKIPTIRQRTLIVWGANDFLIPVENGDRFHRDLPNDTLVVMPNAGHVPMEELPKESVRIVRRFLD